jgi:ribonuclease E
VASESNGPIDATLAETAAADGERSSGRRRRRGGRGGRDRDDARSDAAQDRDALAGAADMTDETALAGDDNPQAAPPVAPGEDGASSGSERERGRRRGGRGGRPRREDQAGDDASAALGDAGPELQPAAAAEAAAAATPQPEPVAGTLSDGDSGTALEPIAAAAAEATALAATGEPAAALVPASVPTSAPSPAPAPVAPSLETPPPAPVVAVAGDAEAALAAPQPAPEAPAAARTGEPFALPLDALHALAASAGLEWVNSDAERILVVQLAMANEPRPVHVPRLPRPRVVIDDGPLVLVETRKDLSQMKLPFEQHQPPAA